METFRNPILAGFYPDPSICRVGEDYYMVTSTFEYFPGVPIFHSKDLVHWRQIGHVLDRPSQLNLDGIPASRGIYAPTLRYHEGVFYMITTLTERVPGGRENFFVTATDPAGPWSDPYWLDNAPGIDPSLFFDDDGKVYYTGNRVPPSGQQYPKHMEIWFQELDLETKQLVGPKHSLWDGALKQAHAQEGPHLYRIKGYYYLLIAEGGTGFTHAVTIARSESLTGPYEVCKRNPILTHRHLGKQHGMVNVGHADLVRTQTGEWWMVCLASRPYGGHYRNMGRETFLVSVEWEDDWPLVNPGKGIIEWEMPKPNLPEARWPALPACDHFDALALEHRWNFIRTPRGEFWSLSERPGYLRLRLKSESISEVCNPSFVGRRQQDISYAVRTKIEFTPNTANETAGLALLQNQDYQYRLECGLNANSQQEVRLVSRAAGEEKVLFNQNIAASKIYLRVEAIGQSLRFDYATEVEQWQHLADRIDGTILSTDTAGGFTGAYIGLFASSNGVSSGNHADFDYFEYIGL
ncbi:MULTISPECIES: glycoside hydrolase family 43 protein [unclassified Paenibacillus]|uniref:glycoside hydrolase family 43 protein n=1 Tax=unclassified Paenibacillus TaxID=185978 RepID=UPI002787E613|nr:MULTISPECIES: glycoside hydrolase family 43 protein [unclassified Paenibacillus]MDQ0902300.1 xylan 1,4-beta-xylosidase [Paenibacillus sp. V4I7]MDQ0919202.1 xylan 1,4-beta-xylosidase [Paenibacillus sp. V4I5]